MKAGLFAKKVGMTQIFDASGTILPVTILKTELCQVSQVKTMDTDGYNAIQVAYGEEKFENINKSTRGHLKKIGEKGFKYFGEFAVASPEVFKLGQVVNLDIFSVGEKVRVTGKSIGKGFAGNQKRHHFTRGPMSHGSKNHRAPGSIGQGTTPGRVYRGKKMAGHMGAAKVTMKKLKILKVDTKQNLLILKGSVPGKPGNLLSIRPTNCKG